MKILSMCEFKEMCDILSPQRFIFSWENQSLDMVEQPMKILFAFPVMLTAFNPNVICFKNSDNYLCLYGVKYIKMNEETPSLGMNFTIVCEGLYDNSLDTEYTITVTK